jgi:hypothetical protein
MLTERERIWIPPSPHGREQLDQPPQLVTAQSTAHGCASHGIVCVDGPQRAASSDAFMHPMHETERVCVTVPVPHAALQLDCVVQSPAVQTIGQSCVLHGTLSESSGHVAPVPTGLTVTERVIIIVPPPQVTLHDPFTQALTSQSTGHACVLHGCVSVAVPGQLARVIDDGADELSVTVRVRFCTPPPHGAEHVTPATQGP